MTANMNSHDKMVTTNTVAICAVFVVLILGLALGVSYQNALQAEVTRACIQSGGEWKMQYHPQASLANQVNFECIRTQR